MRAGAILVGICGLLWGSAASGDWLVTRDGERVETQGPWEVKGRQILFTLPNGTLSMMRVADVDLEASGEATAQERRAESELAASEAAAVQPLESRPAVSKRRKAVLVVTNESLGSGAEAESEDAGVEEELEAEEPDADPDSEEAETDPEPVEIGSWQERDSASGDGLEIVGVVRNTGPNIAADIRVMVTVPIPDSEEESTFETQAFLGSTALTPGKQTSFRALLPGIYSLLEDPSFDIQSDGFSVGGAVEPSTEEESSEDFDEDLADEDSPGEDLAGEGPPALL